jgi:hypothetical protein
MGSAWADPAIATSPVKHSPYPLFMFDLLEGFSARPPGARDRIVAPLSIGLLCVISIKEW